VLRADVNLSDSKGPDMIGRVVCWTSKEGRQRIEIAVDSRVPLLEHSAPERGQASPSQ